MAEHNRNTDAPFGQEEADDIRAQMGKKPQLTCPRCRGPLVSGEPVAGGASLFEVFSVRCPDCRRSLFSGGPPAGSS